MIVIREGDRVRHKTRVINGGLDMPVLEVEGDKALCSHFHPKDATLKGDWFSLNQLELVHSSDGGFKNEGER